MSLPDFFAQHPVFTREDLVCHLVARSGHLPKPRTVQALVRYHQKTGRILMVRRGLYATVPPGSTPDTVPVDAYLVGAQGCPGGVLAYHTALELHGLAHSTFESIQILVSSSVRGWRFRGVDYRPIRSRKALGQDALHLGVEKLDRRGVDLRVTTPARTLVDVLDRPDLGGGWEEVWRSLETLRWVEADEVQAYLERLGNATTSALVGFFLEQHQETLPVNPSVLQALEPLRPQHKQYLDRKRGGRLAKRWNLIVPEALWVSRWEEPA